MAKLNIDRIQKEFEKNNLRENPLKFSVGDTVNVSYKIEEGGKSRIQKFRGIVIAQKGGGARRTFTVRKMSQGIGVERIFPVNSPHIADVNVIKETKVRRSKIYYMRDRTGKAASKVK